MDDDNSSIQSSQWSQEQPTRHDSESDDDISEVAGGIERASLQDGADDSNRNSNLTSNAETTPSEKTAGPPGSTDINLQQCLFCNYDSPTLALNVVHMERIHGMFIPERQYLVDLEGLVRSLYEKIYEFHECLYCGKLKPSVFGLQTHMRDKGHCKIRFDTEDEQLEIGEFYDFTSTYSDVEDDLSEDEMPGKEQSGGVRLGSQSGNIRNREDEMEDADGWETDSSASSLDSADLTAVPLDQHTHQYEKLNRHPHHSHVDPRPHHNRDGWHSHAHKHTHAVFYSDYELHLPSGRAVGHRSLNKYYRQNLHNHPSPAERQERYAIEAAARSDSDDEDNQMTRNIGGERGRALTSRGNGGLGMIGVTDQKKREILATEKRARKVEERERRRFQWGNNKQSNSQKHFRVSFTTLDRICEHANKCCRIHFCSRPSSLTSVSAALAALRLL